MTSRLYLINYVLAFGYEIIHLILWNYAVVGLCVSDGYLVAKIKQSTYYIVSYQTKPTGYKDSFFGHFKRYSVS